jgi:hypothetical protein
MGGREKTPEQQSASERRCSCVGQRCFLSLIPNGLKDRHMKNERMSVDHEPETIVKAADSLALVTKDVVARAASVSPRTIENWMVQRRIPYIRLSPRCVRFHITGVLAALRKFEVKEVGQARKNTSSWPVRKGQQ